MEPTSPEQYDDRVTDGEESGEDGQDLKQEDGPSHTAGTDAAGTPVPAVKPFARAHKRRRVTRACDECRRKKIKCDGKQPCTHCTVYSYECSYDQPSNRRRNPAPQYVENLEHRVHRAETLLHILIPNLDLNDPGIDVAVAQGWIPGAPGKGTPAIHPTAPPPPQAESINGLIVRPAAGRIKSDMNLESMVRAVAQMDIDEQGHWDYHGHSSGLSFVRRMREQLGDLMGPDTASTPFVKSRPSVQVLDSPKAAWESPSGYSSPGGPELPPIDYARQVCSNAIDDAAALLRVLHKPSFWQSFEHLYDTPSESYTNEDNNFLPLFHSAMALGHLFAKDDPSRLTKHGYESAIQQGFTHFKNARQLMDITDCRDLSSIQAVMFLCMFMQSSAKLSQCYVYVGVALRSAMRMGLHRSYVGNFDPIEAELRKRIFWTIRKLDVYIGAMLGLPQVLSDDDIDQDFPTEVDDEYITKDGILPMPEGQVSLMTAFNAHTRLVQIIHKIVQKVYPIKTQHSTPDKSYSVPFSVIRDIEGDLERWKTSLPAILSPCQAPERYTRVQQLLRISYAHAQVMLYRPFLHFVAMEKRSTPVDQRAYACAASYVNVSRNIIHITTQMKQRGLLNGAFWFVMYTSFFAILSLVYFAAENPDNATTQAVMKDALEGKQTLASLASRSMAADRCTATLNVVFQRLPVWMQEGLQNPVMSAKRRREPSPSVQASRSHTDISVVGRETIGFGGLPQRASTFPDHGQILDVSPTSYDPSWSSSSSSMFNPLTPTTNGFESNAAGRWTGQSGDASINGSGPQQYTLPQNFANPALPDLSAMMFPSADDNPFGYPNQPLTTFENNQQYAKNSQYGNGQAFSGLDSSTSMMPPHSLSREDNMEAQLFALPPYIQQQRQHQRQPQHPRQQQHQHQHPSTSSSADALNFGGNGQSMGTPSAMQLPNGMPNSNAMPSGSWPAQQNAPNDLSNINIQAIFGGAEWNPMLMNSGY
ncbi:hypothetical protein LTR08_001887 [Meristemomyces frigidus]|nr:hypothetical protein LTR08_001887 [Meristemomyces frigidus]